MARKGMFKKTARSITDVAKAARGDTMGDYSATANVLDSIFGNLATAGAGTGAALTAAQDRQLAAIQRMTARTAAKSKGIQSRAQSNIVNRYGSAMGPAGERALGVAAATGAATRTATQAIAKGAGTMAEAGQEAMQISQDGVEKAGAAADYALAVALKSRFQDDQEQVAQMRADLQSAKMDHRWTMEAARQQAKLDWKYREMELDKMAELENDPDKAGQLTGLTQAAGGAADAFPLAQRLAWTKDEDGNYIYKDSTALSAAVIKQMGVSNPDEAMFINNIIRAMWTSGVGPNSPGQMSVDPETRQNMVVDAIIEELTGAYPQYAESIPQIRSYIESHGTAMFSAWTTGNVNAAIKDNGHPDGTGDIVFQDQSWWDQIKWYATHPFTARSPDRIEETTGTAETIGALLMWVAPEAAPLVAGGEAAALGAGATRAALPAAGATTEAAAVGTGAAGAATTGASAELVATRIAVTSGLSKAELATLVSEARAGGPGSAAWNRLAALVQAAENGAPLTASAGTATATATTASAEATAERIRALTANIGRGSS